MFGDLLGTLFNWKMDSLRQSYECVKLRERLDSEANRIGKRDMQTKLKTLCNLDRFSAKKHWGVISLQFLCARHCLLLNPLMWQSSIFQLVPEWQWDVACGPTQLAIWLEATQSHYLASRPLVSPPCAGWKQLPRPFTVCPQTNYFQVCVTLSDRNGTQSWWLQFNHLFFVKTDTPGVCLACAAEACLVWTPIYCEHCPPK